MHLENETIDGMLLGLRLATDQNVTARREAYYTSLRADRGRLSGVPRNALENAATGMGLVTLPGAVERIDLDDLIERIARCMQGKARPLWLAALEPST